MTDPNAPAQKTRRTAAGDVVLSVQDLQVTFPSEAGPVRAVRGLSFDPTAGSSKAGTSGTTATCHRAGRSDCPTTRGFCHVTHLRPGLTWCTRGTSRRPFHPSEPGEHHARTV